MKHETGICHDINCRTKLKIRHTAEELQLQATNTKRLARCELCADFQVAFMNVSITRGAFMQPSPTNHTHTQSRRAKCFMLVAPSHIDARNKDKPIRAKHKTSCHKCCLIVKAYCGADIPTCRACSGMPGDAPLPSQLFPSPIERTSRLPRITVLGSSGALDAAPAVLQLRVNLLQHTDSDASKKDR